MKLKAVLLLPVIGVLALPGDVSVAQTPEARLAAMQAQLGVAVDPNAPTSLSVVLPTEFTTLDVSADPFSDAA